MFNDPSSVRKAFIAERIKMAETQAFIPQSENLDQLRTKVLRITEPDNTPEQIRDMYDSWSKTFETDKKLVPNKGPELVSGLVNKYAPNKDVKILDIGAGSGLLGRELKPLGFTHIDGVDPSSGMLDEARKNGAYERLILDFVGKNQMDVKEDTYDVITGVGVFVPNHITEESFDELHRILKPGGLFILMVSDKYKAEKYGCLSNKLDDKVKEFVNQGKWEEMDRTSIPYFDQYNADVTIIKKKMPELETFVPQSENLDQLRIKVLRITEPDNTPEQIRDMYDSWSNTFETDKKLVPNRGPEIIAGFVKQYAPDKNVKILDIGCGTGLLGSKLQDVGFTHVDGVEPSSGMLDKARERGAYERLILDFVGKNQMDIKEDTYDVITGCGVFIPNHITEESFDELNRILKPGGHFVLMVSDKYKAEKYGCLSGKVDDRVKEFVDAGKWEQLSRTNIEYFDVQTATVTILKKK